VPHAFIHYSKTVKIQKEDGKQIVLISLRLQE
jgi:hypothetical protein